jgi:hypothetical protein
MERKALSFTQHNSLSSTVSAIFHLVTKSLSNPSIIALNTGFSRIDELESQVLVYPNPSSDRIYITANSPIEEIWLIDMQGKMQDVKWNKRFLNISDLPAGVYFLNARLGAKLIHHKIVKVN